MSEHGASRHSVTTILFNPFPTDISSRGDAVRMVSGAWNTTCGIVLRIDSKRYGPTSRRGRISAKRTHHARRVNVQRLNGTVHRPRCGFALLPARRF